MRFKVFAIILFITVLLGFSQGLYSQEDDWYMGKPIREISFTGLSTVAQNELDALMYPYRGRIFSDTIFWEILGKLYALEYFERIDPATHRYDAAGSEVIISFNVIERPVITRITFAGNSNLRRSELQDVVTSRVNSIYNQSKVRVDIQAIINKYHERGYPNVAVTSIEDRSVEGTVSLIFSIDEGSRISISRIEFQGNTRFSSNVLRNQISLKARSLLNDGAFQEAKLLADIETILKYYHDRGYINAQVRDVTRSYEEDDRGTNLILTFMIEEGVEYRFGGVTFEGNHIFSSEQLQRLIYSRTGEVVNMTRLEMDLQRVADLYFENGYIFNSIVRLPEVDTQTNVLSVKIEIEERGRAYVENIIIIGNQKTRTEVILREIPMEPGDVFSRAKVLEAIRNIYNLQYFTMVIPDIHQGSTENLMDLVITVEEGPTTDIQFGLTFSASADPDTFPIAGLLQWNDRNIGGSGNQLGIEINSTVVDTFSGSLNYTHNWIFGLPLSVGADFSINYLKRYAAMDNQLPIFSGYEEFAFPDGFMNYDEYIANSRIPPRDFQMEYEQWYLSIGLSTGYRWLTPLGILGLGGGMRYGLIQNTYDEILRPFDPTLREGNNTWVPKNSFWLAVTLDQRDIFYDPSSGYFFYERFGLYGVLDHEREHYLRSDTKAQFYMTLFDIPVNESWNFKGVLAMQAGLSIIFPQPWRGSFAIEDANKLAVDGMFTGRGWNIEYRNKGLVLFDSWIELRIPLVQGILAFDFFFDLAAVEKREGDYFNQGNFTISNFKFSYGGGIRFTLPQFPIRMSLVKRFEILDDWSVKWAPGAIFGDPSRPWTGMDLVISFVITY